MKYSLVLLFVGTIGCSRALDLDVSYSDAGTLPAVDAGGGGVTEGSARTTVPSVPVNAAPAPTFEACPCDVTEGLGCCLAASGPYCTNDHEQCKGDQGALFRCFAPDPLSESFCCWNGAGPGALTAYGADCGTRPEACTDNSHCSNGKTCITKACGAVTIGACGREPPACPF